LTVRVKICGITNREDALHAAASGADALGFVFYSGSPRYVTPETVAAICSELPPFVIRVGLFVNESVEMIRGVAGECGLDALQLHGDESPQACLLPPYRVIKGLRPLAGDDLAALAIYPVSALLVDAAVPGHFGGTGQRADWALAAKLAVTHRVVLAGGLTPDNVAAAITQVRPYAVDVSSGVESAPGKKDPLKVAEFIRNAKRLM
jgi:phosphoribosylanthranilate isomerase